jgi:alpha-glucosidase (family GH31 glycosyl hydrolase)
LNGNSQVCTFDPATCPDGNSQTDCCLQCTTVEEHSTLDFPPYPIHNAYLHLSTKTMSMTARHYNNVSVYDAHNLYGLTEQIATNKALVDIRGKRPFILSRSSFLSTGVHSAKWTGDNGATWNDLRASIISIMDFNLFGVPMVGADICGFSFNTTEELCARWIEAGAFYPFSRDHSGLGTAPQELYLWDSVSEAAKNALGLRYQMLPYMYTLFYQANTVGATVARALWVNYPTDPEALTIDRQFMLGSAILVSPVLERGVDLVKAYFPQGLWYNFKERSLAVDASAGGVTKILHTPLTSVNVHMAGGNITPLQESAMTTSAGRQTPFTLLTALCPGGKAYGSLFWDDGEQVSLTQYLSVSYSAEIVDGAGSFRSVVLANSYPAAQSNVVQTITVMWTSALAAPTAAILNGRSLSREQIRHDRVKNSVTFTNLHLRLTEPIELTWK